MLDMNYFKNDAVLFFLGLTTFLFIVIIIYRKYHGIRLRSPITITMFFFYASLIFSGIYLSYYEVLADFYYKHHLYNEAAYRYMESDKTKNTTLYKALSPLLISKVSSHDKNKMMSFYASKNYSRAIPYLLKNYKKSENIKEKIFIKLYLSHAYLETGNKKGRQLFQEAYIEALCKLSPKDLHFFEGIIQLNTTLKTIVKV